MEADAEAEIERLKRGYGKELADTEAELCEAMGIPYDEEYGWVTGDHTVCTLAMTLRRRVDRVLAEHDPDGTIRAILHEPQFKIRHVKGETK